MSSPARTKPSRPDRGFTFALLAIVGVGLVIRLVAAHLLLAPEPTSDDYWFHTEANLLADGHWFPEPFALRDTGVSKPTALHPPLYAVYLAAGSVVGLRSYGAHSVMTCLSGAATVAVLALLARRLAGDRAGLLAGAMAAVYPNIWLHDTVTMSESLYLLLVAGLLLVAVRQWEAPSRGGAVGLGLLLGAAVLTRTEALAFLVLVVPPVYLRRRGPTWREGVRGATAVLVALAAAAVLVVPWSAWNTARFDHLVTVSNNSGEVFGLANCPQTYDSHSQVFGYWTAECFGVPDQNEAVQGARWRSDGLHYLGDHLGRVPVVVAARLGATLGVYRPFHQVDLGEIVEFRNARWGRVGAVAYWLLVPLAVVGAVVLRRRRRPVWLLLAPAVAVVLVSAAVYGSIRFRVGAEGPLVVLAAVAIDQASAGARSRRGPSSSPAPASAPA